jgi:hypothetical protein
MKTILNDDPEEKAGEQLVTSPELLAPAARMVEMRQQRF